jgi:broad specificity phosphatase PhoE
MESTSIPGLRLPALLALCLLARSAEPPRTVFLVRHAERAGGMSADAGITEAGRCRAETLARMLAGAGVKAIYVTEAARTQQTAEPLAKKLGIHPTAIAAADVDGLLARLRAREPGNVLVVAHAATLPDIVKRLGGGAVPPVADDEYDRLYVVTLTGPGEASLAALRYPGCAP